MPQYYGVARSYEYLAHYGVKGMKWGVRKALERGSDRALRRQRIKAERKLNKLMKLGTNKDKYKKRAIAYGLSAVKLGGLAAAGTGGVASAISRLGTARFVGRNRMGTSIRKIGESGILNGTNEGKAIAAFGKGMQGANASKKAKRLWDASKSVRKFGESNSIGTKITGGPDWITTHEYVDSTGKTYGQIVKHNPNSNSALRKITNEQYLRGAAALGAAGLGAAAARNAYRAKTADRNIIRAAQWKAEMDRTFAGTKYANGVPSNNKRIKKRRRSQG